MLNSLGVFPLDTVTATENENVTQIFSNERFSRSARKHHAGGSFNNNKDDLCMSQTAAFLYFYYIDERTL